MKTILYNTLFIFFFCISNVFSQVAVVSEYNNVGGDANGEWTEILIVSDNVNLVGCIMRDNSDANSWSGGIKFKDTPLWQNLRIGTILVITHRYNALLEDKNPSDGYLEVSAEDGSLFDKVTYNNPDWTASALSINQTNDMIQLLDANGENIHTLGHTGSTTSQPYNEFLAINGPKIMRNGSINNNNSLKVVPGASVSDYCVGYDNSNSYTYTSSTASKGFPNQSPAYPNSNQQFWRNLRQPNWFNPNSNTSVTIIGQTARISWAPAEASTNMIEGYLILRIPYASINLADLPVDGKSYNKGDFLGSALVIGNVYGFSNSTFNDNDFGKADCGEKYVYRIFAFRYEHDNQNKDGIPENGRGRSYNEDNFAETNPVEKILPEKPVIETPNGKFEFCASEPILLKVKGVSTADATLQWYKDGTMLTGETSTTLKVSSNGQYYVVVKNLSSLCENTSESVQITIYPVPVASLFIVVNGNMVPITKDTTIFVCKDEDPNFDYPRLNLQGANIKEWYFDDRLKTEELNKVEIIAAQKGMYYGVVKNGVCSDTSFKVYIVYFDIRVVLSPSSLFFDADDSPIQKLKIINKSNTVLNIKSQEIQLPINFSFVNINWPLVINKNDSIEVEISYNRTTPGTDNGKIKLFLMCFSYFQGTLQGVKKAPGTAGLISIPDTLDFGLMPICDLENNKSKTIDLKSFGTIPTKVFTPIYSSELSSINSNYPIVLEPDSNLIVKFDYMGNASGFYSGTIRVPYESFEKNPKSDTLDIPWKIEIVNPKLDFKDSLNIFIATCTDTAFQQIEFTNNTKLPITISKDFINSNIVSLQNLPVTIDPGEIERITIRTISSINQTLNDKLEISPCNVPQNIYFNIVKSNISVKAKQSNIDFGTIAVCPQFLQSKKEAEILLSGGNVTIKSINYIGDFISDLSIGQILNFDKKFNIIYTGSQTGPISGKITITLDPCDFQVEYNLAAFGTIPSLTLNPDSLLDFGNVEVSTIIPKNIQVKNNSPFDVVISASIDNPKFWINPTIQFPLTLIANETKMLPIEFKNDIEGDTETGKITFSLLPCEVNYSVNLKAITNSNKVNGTVIVNLPEILSGKIGETINLPLKIEPQNFNLKDSKIEKVNYYFRYDGVQIYPNNVSSLNSGGWINGSSIKLTENSMNSSVLEINLNGLPNPANNQWLDINLSLLVLQSQVKESIFYLDSLVFISEGNITTKLDSTKIQVLDNCELQNRNITFDNTNQIPKINQTADNLQIEFYTIADGDVSIKLVSSNGEIIDSKKYEDVKHGTYTTNLDLSKLQSGVYLLEVKTPTGVFVQKIIIIR